MMRVLEIWSIFAIGVSAYEFKQAWTGHGSTRSGSFATDPDYFNYGDFTGSVNEIHFLSNNTAIAVAVNAGLYKTSNFGDDVPVWRRFEVSSMSPAISTVAIDKGDPNIMVAASGMVSSFSGMDAYLSNGIARSENGGETWTQVFVADGSNTNFVKVASMQRGRTVIACANSLTGVSRRSGLFPGRFGRFVENAGIYISQDGGAFEHVWRGECFDILIASEDEITETAFIATQQGFFRTNDGIFPFTNFPVVNIEPLEVANHLLTIQQIDDFTLLVSFATTENGPGVFMYTETPWASKSEIVANININQGFTSTPKTFPDYVSLPQVIIGQAAIHGAFIAHPTEKYHVFQAGTAWKAGDYIGNGMFVARGDVRDTTSYVPVMSLNEVPHADSRYFAFSMKNDLVVACDGGLFSSPNALISDVETARWVSKAGTMKNIEAVCGDYDPISGFATVGLQDNGCMNFNARAPGPANVYADARGDGGTAIVANGNNGPVFVNNIIFGYYNAQTDANFNPIYNFPDDPVVGGVFPTQPQPNGNFIWASNTNLWFASLRDNGVYETEIVNLDYHMRSEQTLGDSPSNSDAVWYIADGPGDFNGLVKIVRGPNGDFSTTTVLETKQVDGNIKVFCVDPMEESRVFISFFGSVGVLENGEFNNWISPELLYVGDLWVVSCRWFKHGDDTALVVGTNGGAFVAFPSSPTLQWHSLDFGLEPRQGLIVRVGLKEDNLIFTCQGTGVSYLEGASAALAKLRALTLTSVSEPDTTSFVFDFSEPVVFGSLPRIELVRMDSRTSTDVTDRTTINSAGDVHIDLDGLSIPEQVLYYLLATPRSIASAADPSIHYTYGNFQSGVHIQPTDVLFLNSFVRGWFSNSDVAAGAPTNLIAVPAEGVTNGLHVQWTPGPMNGCVFTSYLVQLKDETGLVYSHFATEPNNNLFDAETASLLIENWDYDTKVTALVSTRCAFDTNNSPVAESGLAQATPPPSQGAWSVTPSDPSATTLKITWVRGLVGACVHADWVVKIGQDPFVPEGCRNLEASATSCIAVGLNPDTDYIAASVRETCTDPLLDSALKYSDQRSSATFPSTLQLDCGGTCTKSESCVDGKCVYVPCSVDCCEASCGRTGVRECVCAFDSFCCAGPNNWDMQCIAEAKDSCGLTCDASAPPQPRSSRAAAPDWVIAWNKKIGRDAD